MGPLPQPCAACLPPRSEREGALRLQVSSSPSRLSPAPLGVPARRGRGPPIRHVRELREAEGPAPANVLVIHQHARAVSLRLRQAGKERGMREGGGRGGGEGKEESSSTRCNTKCDGACGTAAT